MTNLEKLTAYGASDFLDALGLRNDCDFPECPVYRHTEVCRGEGFPCRRCWEKWLDEEVSYE